MEAAPSMETTAPMVAVTAEVATQEPVSGGIVVKKKKDDVNNFSIPIIIAAALIFIVIIAWFESLRVWLEFAFNTSTTGLFNKALADMVYAISATVIAILLIFLILKYWMKKI